MKREFFELCKFKSHLKCVLIYRASQNGFEASDFHSRCDNIPKTVTIIQSYSGYVFGGYAKATWNDPSKKQRNR